ncbi:MAG: AzlC family ABC transporter permease [Burkholderiaceae bacterium]|nr:AzlC family ABC transporter permease [Burkholderiaceae bacterium]
MNTLAKLRAHLLPPLDLAYFREGALNMAPVTVAIASWGLVTGVAMVKSGLTVPLAVIMTLTVFAGSAQLASLPLLAMGAPLPVIWISAMVVNLRFVLFSAASREYFASLSWQKRLFAAYLNGDIGFALFMQRFGSASEKGTAAQWGFFFGGATVNWCAWQSASIAGIFLGGLVPSAWGLELAAALALTAVLIPMAANLPALLGVMTAGALSVITTAIPLKLGLLLSVVVGVIVAVVSEPLAHWTQKKRILSEDAQQD